MRYGLVASAAGSEIGQSNPKCYQISAYFDFVSGCMVADAADDDGADDDDGAIPHPCCIVLRKLTGDSTTIQGHDGINENFSHLIVSFNSTLCSTVECFAF